MNDLVQTHAQGKTTLPESARRWQREAGALVGSPMLPPKSEREGVLRALKAGLWASGAE